MAKKAGFIQRKERGDKAVTLVSYILMGIAGFLALAPFVHVVSKAFSSASAVTSGQVTFYPREPQIETVKFILTETMFLKSLMNTVIVTVAGTILSMLVTITTAYP